MIYTEQTKLAMRIAYDAHHGQVDKGGMPYIFHPIHIAEGMHEETEIAAALLHDVVEDTRWGIEELRKAGVSEDIIGIVDLLTRPKDMAYMDYIKRLAPNKSARAIKIADLIHNMDTSRLCVGSTVADHIRSDRYDTALVLLSER